MIDTIPFLFRAGEKKTKLRLLKFSKLHQTKNYVVHNTTHSVPNYHKKSLPNIYYNIDTKLACVSVQCSYTKLIYFINNSMKTFSSLYITV